MKQILKLTFTLLFFSSYSQINQKAISIEIDKAIGEENLIIYQGDYHINEYPLSDKSKHRYFYKDFETGHLVYHGEYFYNVSAKYDVYRDQLILKPPNENSGLLGIILNSKKIDSFQIKDVEFVNAEKTVLSKFEKSGFYESVTYDDLILFIKYHKTISNRIRNQMTFYEFKDNSKLFIYHNKDLTEINSIEDLIELLPNHSKKIEEYRDDYSQLYKNHKVAFYKNLLASLNSSN